MMENRCNGSGSSCGGRGDARADLGEGERERGIALGPSGGANRQWRGLCDSDLTESEGRRGMGGARAAVGDLAEGEGRHAR